MGERSRREGGRGAGGKRQRGTWVVGGARQLIGLRVCRSPMLCKGGKRNRRKKGRHLGSSAGKRQASGSCWKEQKSSWTQFLGLPKKEHGAKAGIQQSQPSCEAHHDWHPHPPSGWSQHRRSLSLPLPHPRLPATANPTSSPAEFAYYLSFGSIYFSWPHCLLPCPPHIISNLDAAPTSQPVSQRFLSIPYNPSVTLLLRREGAPHCSAI